jgi:hypothetical protein
MSYATALRARLSGNDNASGVEGGMTEVEAAKVRAALVAARAGGGSLTQLGEAHDIAGKYAMTKTQEEIIAHIRNLVKAPLNGRAAAKVVARTLGIGISIGILAGITTHFLLVAFGQRRVPEPRIAEAA